MVAQMSTKDPQTSTAATTRMRMRTTTLHHHKGLTAWTTAKCLPRSSMASNILSLRFDITQHQHHHQLAMALPLATQASPSALIPPTPQTWAHAQILAMMVAAWAQVPEWCPSNLTASLRTCQLLPSTTLRLV